MLTLNYMNCFVLKTSNFQPASLREFTAPSMMFMNKTMRKILLRKIKQHYISCFLYHLFIVLIIAHKVLKLNFCVFGEMLCN